MGSSDEDWEAMDFGAAGAADPSAAVEAERLWATAACRLASLAMWAMCCFLMFPNSSFDVRSW